MSAKQFLRLNPAVNIMQYTILYHTVITEVISIALLQILFYGNHLAFIEFIQNCIGF